MNFMEPLVIVKVLMQRVFEEHKHTFTPGKKPTKGVSLIKDENFYNFQKEQVDNFRSRITKLKEQATQYDKGHIFNRTGANVGNATFDNHIAVFTDAHIGGVPLTARQKNIIESHERGHFVRRMDGGICTEIDLSLDVLEDKDRKYLTGVEVLERMSQLKNYFGFKGNEIFTKAHLDYARANYLKDTGLDNTMTAFFSAITPETEAKFLEVINKYPI